jgi:hypothetical protein
MDSQHVVRQPFRRLLADARQFGEFVH